MYTTTNYTTHSTLQPTIDPIEEMIYEERRLQESSKFEGSSKSQRKSKTTHETPEPPKGKYNEGKKKSNKTLKIENY